MTVVLSYLDLFHRYSFDWGPGPPVVWCGLVDARGVFLKVGYGVVMT